MTIRSLIGSAAGVVSVMLIMFGCGGARAQTASDGSGAPQAYTLRYKFAVGQIRNYNATIDMSGTATFKGQSMPIAQHMAMLLTQTVTSVYLDGSASIATHITSAQATVNGNAVPYTDDQIAQMQKSMPSYTLSPNGAIRSTPGADGAAADGDPSGYTNFSRALALPDGPVKTGDMWRGSMSAMGLTFFTRSTLGQVTRQGSDGIAQIQTKYYGETAQKGMKGPAGSTLYMLTSGTGATRFDTTTGTMMQMSNNLNTKVTITPPPGLKAGLNAPVKTHLVISMKMELLGDDTPSGQPGAP